MSHFSLRCDDLTLCYDRRPAVHHLTAAFPCGALVGVVGPNGAGKSTLLHGLLGWLPWTTGQVTLDGEPIQRCARRVSFLAQRRTQDVDFPADVESVVATGVFSRRRLFGGFTAEDRSAVDAALGHMGLADLRRRPLAALSGGQQQRVFIARALATGAEILLLDEPLTGLDEPSSRDLLIRLREWAGRDRLVVASIHDLSTVRAWCTHVLLLNRELIAYGPTAEALTDAHRARCYAPAGA